VLVTQIQLEEPIRLKSEYTSKENARAGRAGVNASTVTVAAL
jgi:hypothetical protein